MHLTISKSIKYHFNILGSIFTEFAHEWPVFFFDGKYKVDATFSAASAAFAAVFINIAT